jgi:hypothetical protein
MGNLRQARRRAKDCFFWDEATFADASGADGLAPIPVVRGVTDEPLESTVRRGRNHSKKESDRLPPPCCVVSCGSAVFRAGQAQCGRTRCQKERCPPTRRSSA